MFREEIAAGSDLGKLAEQYISRGQLVPDEAVIRMVDHWMRKERWNGFIFDGFPRTLRQGESFQKLLADRGLALDRVVYLHASREMVEERILGRLVCDGCGRSYHVRRRPPRKEGICDVCGAKVNSREDDNMATLNRRWKVYEAQTAGLADFYRGQSLLREVSAAGKFDEMCARVWDALEEGVR